MLDAMWDLGMETAAQYAITHVMYLSLPHNFAIFLLPNVTEREQAVGELKELVLAVLHAHQVIAQGEASSALKDCFQDLGWTKMQICLEMVGLLLQGNFYHSDAACMRLAQKIFLREQFDKGHSRSCVCAFARRVLQGKQKPSHVQDCQVVLQYHSDVP